MITIKLTGGLGNQMFQFAAASALRQRHGCDLAIDINALRPGTRLRLRPRKAGRDTPRTYMLDCFDLPVTPRRRSHIYGKLRHRLGLEALYREPHFHFDPTFHSLRDPVTLVGYFQSERYFSDIADDIRAMFTLKRPLSENGHRSLAEIASAPESVALHVRRGDFITNHAAAQYHLVLDTEYYRRALQLITERLNCEPHVFLFSDDPQYIAEAFSFVHKRTVIQGNIESPWEDMALMARCRHHITANSSFSWWGAWLAKRPSQIVVAPRHWFKGHAAETNNLKDLYPTGWLTMS